MQLWADITAEIIYMKETSATKSTEESIVLPEKGALHEREENPWKAFSEIRQVMMNIQHSQERECNVKWKRN